jgi:hyperosmotically inducible protein
MRILRALLLSILIIIVGFVAFAYLSGSSNWRFPGTRPAETVGTSGTIDTDKVRARGAQVGEKIGETVGVAAAKVGKAVDEATLTSKIKAKMVLDDSVKARAIDVSTTGTVVTLSGTVASQSEHDRAVALARETDGVTRVVDRLAIQR